MAAPTLFFPPVPNNTVKDLAESASATSSFPSNYITRSGDGYDDDDHDDEEIAVQEEIPIIDFSKLIDGNPEQRKQIVQELGCACQDWGFFMVVNHGVPAAVRAAMMDACSGFFDLTAEEKEEYAGRHVMDPIRCGTSFNSTVEDARYWRDYFKIFVHPVFHSPAKPLVFREASENYVRHMRGLAKELLKTIWESLDLEDNSHIREALGLASCFQVLVGNLYPPCPQPKLAWGLPAHSDHGLITILMQNGTDGLQVMHHDQWVGVKPLPNSFLVNIGDHMEIFSNGRYKSVLHRATVNKMRTRMSVVSLIGPSLDAIVVPWPELLEREKRSAAYRGIKYGDFMEYQQGNQLKEKSVLDLLRF